MWAGGHGGGLGSEGSFAHDAWIILIFLTSP
jgi:hypothetical protein